MAENDQSMTTQYFLTCDDDVTIEVTKKFIVQSEVLNELASFQTDEKVTIPVKNITSKVLQRIIDFSKHYEDDKPYVPPQGRDAAISLPPEERWDVQFLSKFSGDELHAIICAANYLNMPRLIDSCCYRINYMIKDKNADQMRKILQLHDDFTPQEKAENEREHTWYSRLR